MNLLNEAMDRYPDALSFAAGRPPLCAFKGEEAISWMTRYQKVSGGLELGQYSPTNGIINRLLSKHLAAEEGLRVAPVDIMVTHGAQEAILIALLAVAGSDGAVAAADPTYVGLTGAAEASGIPLVAIPDGEDFIGNLARALMGPQARPIRAVYVIPDFSNPSSRTMSQAEREALLALARRHDIRLIEDATYRAFRYDGMTLPSLKALDRDGRVILVTSFAKSFLPGVRIGMLAADEAAAWSWIKSYTTVATSPILQAMLGGFLIEQEGRLFPWLDARWRRCRDNREAMLAAVAKYLAPLGATWQVPEGGFFLALRLPRPFDAPDLEACARDAGVIVMPMILFSPGGLGGDQIRLAFSNLETDAIAPGIARLAGYLGPSLCEAAAPPETRWAEV